MRIPAGLKGRIICIRWFGHTEEESIFGTESGDIKITNDNFLSTGLIPDDSANLKKTKYYYKERCWQKRQLEIKTRQMCNVI